MPRKLEPTLESVTIRGKYEIPQTDFEVIYKSLIEMLKPNRWQNLTRIGDSICLIKWDKPIAEDKDPTEAWHKYLNGLRMGLPAYFGLTVIERHRKGILVEIECRPVMWQKIATERRNNFTENEVQEALIECRNLVKRVMSAFKGREIEPVSVYPIIQRTEAKSRLLNLGLKRIVNLLDKAEKHIAQNNFSDSLKSSRTAFEKMIDWQMKKRGLEQTGNYKNNLERLRARGHLDKETTNLLQAYYRCLSNVGVHERGIEAGIYEAQMGYGITLIMLQYFADKLA